MSSSIGTSTLHKRDGHMKVHQTNLECSLQGQDRHRVLTSLNRATIATTPYTTLQLVRQFGFMFERNASKANTPS